MVHHRITQFIAVLVGTLKIQKISITLNFEPKTSRILTSILNRYATSITSSVSILNLDDICIVFPLTTLFFTWWLVSNVRRRPRLATRSGHDVACPGFNTYLPKAKACLTTRFGSTDVAADGRPSEKQAAAGQLAGGGAVNAHEAGQCAASESCARGRQQAGRHLT